MTLFRSYIGPGLSSEELQTFRRSVDLADESSPTIPHGALRVMLLSDDDVMVFQFEDEFGPICQTLSLDAALILIHAGPNARNLLGLPSAPKTFGRVQTYVDPEPQVLVEVDPKMQAIARRRAEAMHVRRDGQVAPPDHTAEGGPIQQVGMGDGAPKIE